MEVIINYSSYDGTQNIPYIANDNTKVRDLLKFLYYEVENQNFVNRDYEEAELIGCFTFKGLSEQKAMLDFPLLKFLDNFKYDLNNVNIIYDPGYGIGASCVFEDIAKIEIRSREPNHAGIPHVHVYKKGKENESISILLTSFEVIPKCEREWNKYYSSNERNLILDFLKVNKEKLSEFYDRCNKGEYITEDYILAYNGKQYDFYVSRTY